MAGWHVRQSSLGTVHVVKQQANPESCGIACVLMVNFRMKKGLMAVGVAAGAALRVVPLFGGYIGSQLAWQAIQYAVKSEESVYRAYAEVSGEGPYDGSAPTKLIHLPQVLERLGCGAWEAVEVGKDGFTKAAREANDAGSPIIAAVEKPGIRVQHAVVVDGVYPGFPRDYATVCDPSDGHVHVVDVRDGAAVTFKSNISFSGFIIRRKF